MINNLLLPNIRLFVFGTLRKGERLDFYMEGSQYVGKYYTEGQLMKAENGSAYIDFDRKNVATIGELHYVNFFCLQRINHLETASGEFPKGYDLDIIPIWEIKKEGEYSFSEEGKMLTFFYRRRNNPIPIESGDWTKHKNPILEINNILKSEIKREITHNEIISHMSNYFNSNWAFAISH